MEINILYFGITGDITGKPNETLTGISTSDELKLFVENKYPKIKYLSWQISINKKIITENTQLKSKDEIAFLPPFAGG